MIIEIGNTSVVEYEIAKNKDGATSGGTTDYLKLSNKPSVNNVILEGNKTLKDLGIQPEGNYLIEHQDLSEYAKKNDIPNIDNYYNKTEVDTMIGDIETLLSEV